LSISSFYWILFGDFKKFSSTAKSWYLDFG